MERVRSIFPFVLQNQAAATSWANAVKALNEPPRGYVTVEMHYDEMVVRRLTLGEALKRAVRGVK